MPRKAIALVALIAIAIAGAIGGRIIFPPPTSDPVTPLPRISATDFDHHHLAFDEILKIHVRDELVDYRSLKSAPEALLAYLGQLAAVTRSEFESWDRDQQLAMLINLYNAATLKLVIDHYPVKGIKSIGGLFKKPWDIEALTLFGETITLNHLEHEILRNDYDEPRIHFAIVCAAKGCPALRPGAYSAEELDVQLEQQGRSFLADPTKNRVDAAAQTIYLSKIFRWFAEDFEKDDGSVIDFVKPYFPPSAAAALTDEFKIRYTDYDWSLNEE